MIKNFLEKLKAKEIATIFMLSSNPERHILRKGDFHKNLKFGDIICSINFTGRKGLVANSIMKMTKSRVTHAAIYVGKGKIIDSTSHRGFVDYTDLMDMKEQILIGLRADLSPSQKIRLKKVISNMLKNKPSYDKRALIVQTVYEITGFFPRWLDAKGEFFCSEFVYECYQKAGCKLRAHEHSQFVSPTSLYESPKLNIVYMLDGINGVKFSRKTRNSNMRIKKEAKKLLLKKIKQFSV
jgi:hypothetical protein